MGKLLAIGVVLLFMMQISYCQRTEVKNGSDSTLLKFVKGIQGAIEKRAIDEGYKNTSIWSGYVIVAGIKGGVPIDSLRYFGINDFKSITVKFNEPYAIYGAQSPYGIIFLEPKNKKEKKPRQKGKL